MNPIDSLISLETPVAPIANITGHNWIVMVGDVTQRLREIPDNSVQCCVTSPPYWGLRDYKTSQQIWGGDPACRHEWGQPISTQIGGGRQGKTGQRATRTFTATGTTESNACIRCGAWKGELGSEPTPEMFTQHLVLVFNEVRRVLRPDGTCFINIGDSYAAARGGTGMPAESLAGGVNGHGTGDAIRGRATRSEYSPSRDCGKYGLKHKDLVGIPWRLAFALQASGWYLRSEIIWHKRSPMPESVTDRPTKAHEQIFILTKSAKYHWDQEAVKEQAVGNSPGNVTHKHAAAYLNGDHRLRTKLGLASIPASTTRNLRSVWTLSSEKFTGAHFAVFPSAIPRTCILAGTSPAGACPACLRPAIRVTIKTRVPTRPGTNSKINRASNHSDSPAHEHSGMVIGNRDPLRHCTTTITSHFTPHPLCTCNHPIESFVPCTVLDPFSGSGTTGMVATQLNQRYIGIELNPTYAELSRTRIDSWKFKKVKKSSKKSAKSPPPIDSTIQSNSNPLDVLL